MAQSDKNKSRTLPRSRRPMYWDKSGKPTTKDPKAVSDATPRSGKLDSKVYPEESGGARPGTGAGRPNATGTANSGPDRQDGASILYPESGGARPGTAAGMLGNPVRAENIREAQEEGPSAWDAVGSLVSGAGKGIKKGAGYLVNEDSWGDIMPGGEEADWKDWANVALDASMLIPGLGVGGALARGGLRAAGKGMLAGSASNSTAARLLANKSTDTARRRMLAGLDEGVEAGVTRGASHLKQGFAADAASAPLARQGLRGRAGGGTFSDKYAKVYGRPMASKLDNIVSEGAGLTTKSSLAARANRAVGLAQTKRGTLLTGALTAGANKTEADTTNELRAAKQNVADDPRNDGIGGPPTKGQGAPVGYMVGTQMYPLAVGESGNIEMPPSTQRAIAEYFAKGGSPDGTQVIYMGS